MKKLIFLPFILLGDLGSVTFASERLNAIVVTSSRVQESVAELPTSVTVIDKQDIEASGYSSLPELLRTVGSIGVSNSGGQGKATTLRIRGEEGFRTLVLIDGVDLSDPTATQVGPQIQHLLLNNDIERIEILRGPQGFIYGADAGGVINMFTPSGDGKLKSNFAFEKGNFDSTKINANFSGGNEKFDFFFSVGDQETDGFNARKSDTSQDDDGYENTTFHGKFGYEPTENLRLQAVTRDVSSTNEFDSCFFGTSTNNCIGEFDQLINKLSINYDNGKFTQYFSVARTEVDRENFANGNTSFKTDGDIDRFEYWGSFIWEDSRIVYGVDNERESITTSSNTEVDRRQIGTYIEYRNNSIRNLFLSAGIREDDNDDFGENTSERVAAAYQYNLPNALLKYRASYGTGFRAPSLSEIAYNDSAAAFPPASDVELKEETSKGFDIGVDFEHDNGLFLQVTYFDQKIEDEIFFDLSGFSGYLQSLGTTRSRGIELFSEIPITDRWEVIANYTYNDTENADGQQRIRRPRHLANIGFKFTSHDQKLVATSNLRVSEDAEDEIFGIGRVELDNYSVVDANISYKFSRSGSLFAGIQNFFNDSYEEVTGFNTAGRSVYVGLRISQ